MDWALVPHKIAVRVSVVHRRQKFRASPASEQKLKELATAGKIDLAVPFQLKALEGKEDLALLCAVYRGKFTTFLRIVYCLSLACQWI